MGLDADVSASGFLRGTESQMKRPWDGSWDFTGALKIQTKETKAEGLGASRLGCIA